jgi:hypothetical protein
MDGMYAGFAGAKTGHRGSALCGCAVRLLRLSHAQPPASSRWRNHCAPSAIGRMAAPIENDVGGAVPIRCFKLIANLTVGGE